MKIKSSKVLKSLIAVILAVLMIVGTTATGFAAIIDNASTSWTEAILKYSTTKGSGYSDATITYKGNYDNQDNFEMSMYFQGGKTYYFQIVFNGQWKSMNNFKITSSMSQAQRIYENNSDITFTTKSSGYYTFKAFAKSNPDEFYIMVTYPQESPTFTQGQQIYFNCVDHENWGDYDIYANFSKNGSGYKSVKMSKCYGDNKHYWSVDVPTTGEYNEVQFLSGTTSSPQNYTLNCGYTGKPYDNSFYPSGSLGAGVGLTTGTSNHIIQNGGFLYFDNSFTNWSENRIYYVTGYKDGDNTFLRPYKMYKKGSSKIFARALGTWGDAKFIAFVETKSDNGLTDQGEYRSFDSILNNCKTCTTFISNFNCDNDKTYLFTTNKYNTSTASTSNPYVLSITKDTNDKGYNMLNSKIALQAQYKNNGDLSYSNIETASKASSVAKPTLTGGSYMSNNDEASNLSNKTGTTGLAKDSYVLRTSSVTLGYKEKSGAYKFDGFYDGETLISSSDTYSVTSSGTDKTYNARFSEITYELSYEESIGGSVTLEKEEVGAIEPVTITATPDSDYEFVNWEVVEGNGIIADVSNPETTILSSSDTTIKANFIEVSDSAKITLYFKSSDSYRYLPSVSIDGTAYEMNKLSEEEELSTGLKLGDNDTHTQTYHWYKKEVFLPKNSTAQLKFTNLYDMAASTTIEVGESNATYCYGVDNLNKGTELIDLSSYYDKSDPSKMAILNFYKSATFMCSNGLDLTLLSSSPAYTNLSGCRRVMGDIDKNDQLSITDVTCLQQGLAKINDLDNISNALADFNLDEVVSISDGTMMQLRLVGLA